MDLLHAELLNIPTCKITYQGRPNALNFPITGFATDSRIAKSDETFLALPGEKFDGHRFISDVRERGVKNFIVSESWHDSVAPSHLDGNFFIVADTLFALQEISRYYRLKFDIPLIALTGSNGKTTTKEMMALVLAERFQVLKNQGNLNNHIGVPISLLGLTRQHEIAVIEMGTNHFGEITRLAEIANPTAGLITNIGPAHLEFFKSLEGVFRAKAELWQFLEKQENNVAFVNADDPFLGKHKPSGIRVVTYGFNNPADVKGQFLKLDAEGRPSFKIEGVEISLGIAGMHNSYNALAAVAVGLEFDVNLNRIKTALEEFLPSSRRMEIIRNKGIIVINDCYNSNPESARKSILTLSQMQAQGKRIAILADMLELGDSAEKEHDGIGEYIASLKNIHYLLTYGPFSKKTSEQAQKLSKMHAIHFENKTELIEDAKRIIKKGDILLIKGSRGMAMEDVTKGIFET
jgi:UDP-N-acetylmuramoyl-tripeptide--D-alanyl-D-alanine ligase